MRRATLQLAVSLVIGAGLNVAVAWVCTIWIAPPNSWEDLDHKAADLWDKRETRVPDPVVGRSAHASQVKGRSRLLLAANGPRDPTPLPTCMSTWPQEFLCVDRAGWPCLSMEAVRSRFNRGGTPVVLRSALVPPDWVAPANNHWSTSPLLPLKPVWPGFVVNWFVYTAATWLVVFSFPIARRVVRIRRHCCPSCGYPIGTSPVCTECGHTLATHILHLAKAA